MDKKELLKTIQVDPDNIVCKTCKFRNQGARYPHYTKANCGIYKEGIANKPNAVLFEGKPCRYYMEEE